MLPLTKIEGVPERTEVVRGMAHFSGTGPVGEICKTCGFYGYYRQARSGKSYYVPACLMFKKLTGRYGPRINKDTAACKYYEKKEIKKGAPG